ncbi:MAG TPA: hypothetical protein VIQ53_06465 [Inquilinus sp.]
MKGMATLALMAALSVADQAAAEPVPADPVERCRGILSGIPPLPLAAATAERVEPVGRRGCRFIGVAGESGRRKASIGLILIERLDFDRVYGGRLPDAVTLRVHDIVLRGDGLPSSVGPFDFVADYDLDVRAKMFTLRELTLRGPTLGELTLSGEVEGYSLPDDGGFWPVEDQDAVRLRQFRLRAVDRGFIGMLLLGQSSSGRDVQAAVADVKSDMSANLARWPAFGVPKPAVEALRAYVGDLPSPRRPITISAKPSTPIPVNRLDPFDPGLRLTMESLNLIVAY